MRKKLPVGIENFEDFRKEDFYFVDKTMFIAELLHNWGQVNLFTRPRCFGKSLNMSMLKTFFKIGTDKTLFDGLKIAQEKELCEKYMGVFPVISITFGSVDGLSFQEAKEALHWVVGTEAAKFSFLESSDRLTDNEKEMYRALIKAENGMFTMPDSLLLTSVQILSKLLSRHYGSKVIILIDAFDVPLDNAFQAGYYDEMVSLIRHLFSNAFKTNEYLYFAVLTGCISRESIFTGLNLNVMTVTDPYFQEAFGFTEKEVGEMLAYYGVEEALETMRDWYCGYQFGGKFIYCPWDVIKYTQILRKDKKARPQNYWANTSGNRMVRRFIGKADRKTRSEIERLIAGESIIKKINQELTYNELDRSIDNLWSVLFTTGYLTQKGYDEEGKLELVIPNREIRELFINQIQEWFHEESTADTKMLQRFCEAFPKGEAATVEEMLNGYLWKSISIRDTAVRKERKENFHLEGVPSVFHGMLLGLLQFENNWEIESNAEAGDGYSDIVIRTQERTGVVIEIKYADGGNLEKACAEALEQIETKKYDPPLRRDGMKEIIKYGIAFYKKQCKVKDIYGRII